ncbi:hypothetical protein [Burkholderia ubonensis]|uniref:RipA family octameric membrane protein n=1 Tax=Burkholderia ubonensis TaxID=101571 RepID=UPI0007538E7D|nr:hypothetical protein [Burkholderia ubonensis]KVD59896.1 hypothetical protein WI88_15415 [Burkholderia ubonensis]KWC63382.1 hypothetical protein WL53_08625 [Burkholderia ubonensis]KWI04475.1 hypothetical protein WM01_27810 [Burkholderia ubonensis]OJA97670.1 hypothetical protein BGV51_21170 [Burkholderia ubonensis]
MEETTTRNMTPDEYLKAFEGEKRKKALERALDTRKFEIDLYWKRATYFWTFIGATLAGFIAIQAGNSPRREILSVLLSCLGTVFSFAWLLVNRGSKYWQENWEKHVDLLEDSETGPLYKITLSRNPTMTPLECLDHLITGPSAFSVSKINQVVSLYVFLLWAFLVGYVIWPLNIRWPINWPYCILVGLTVAACSLFLRRGRTYKGGYWHYAAIRESRIKPPGKP